jgi:hypothetical protein
MFEFEPTLTLPAIGMSNGGAKSSG